MMVVSDEDSLWDFVAFGCVPFPRAANPRITETKDDSLDLSLHYLNDVCPRIQTLAILISSYLIRERRTYSNVWTIKYDGRAGCELIIGEFATRMSYAISTEDEYRIILRYC